MKCRRNVITIILMAVLFLLVACTDGDKPISSRADSSGGSGRTKNGKYVVGDGIRMEDITDFYFSFVAKSDPPKYQRYRFYVEDGAYLFYHETREGDQWPLTEEDITIAGSKELTNEEWTTLFDYLKGGSVEKRTGDMEAIDDGSVGPETYLYWEGDRSKYRLFTVASYKKQRKIEAYCSELKELSRDTTQKEPSMGDIYGDWEGPEEEHIIISDNDGLPVYEYYPALGYRMTYGRLEETEGEQGSLTLEGENGRGGAPLIFVFSYDGEGTPELVWEGAVFRRLDTDNPPYDSEIEFSVYAPILIETSAVVKEGYDVNVEFEYISDGLRERVMYEDSQILMESIGYCYLDLGGDGVPELLIGENMTSQYSDPGEQGYLYSIYTCKDDEPHLAFEAWGRSSYRWLGDGSLLYVSPDAVGSTAFGVAHVTNDGTGLQWDDLYFTGDKNGEIAFYHNQNGEWDAEVSEELEITADAFWKILSDYEKEIKALSLTPIGTY